MSRLVNGGTEAQRREVNCPAEDSRAGTRTHVPGLSVLCSVPSGAVA